MEKTMETHDVTDSRENERNDDQRMTVILNALDGRSANTPVVPLNRNLHLGSSLVALL
jgi:hypothetical protein